MRDFLNQIQQHSAKLNLTKLELLDRIHFSLWYKYAPPWLSFKKILTACLLIPMPSNKFQMFCHVSCEQCHLPEVAFHGCLPWLPPRIHLPLSNAAWIKGIKALMQQRLLIIWYNWEEMKINEVEDGEAISWAACTAVFSARLPWPFLWWGMCKLTIMTNTLFPKLFSWGSLKLRFSLLRFKAVFSLKRVMLILRFLKSKALCESSSIAQDLVFPPTVLGLAVVWSTGAGFVVLTEWTKSSASLSATESLDHSTTPDVFDTDVWCLVL